MRKYIVIILLMGSLSSACDLFASPVGQNSEATMKNGWSFRKQLMIDYGTFVNAKNEVSLREFGGGDDDASRAVGHAKTVLVFHLLRRIAGEEKYLRLVNENISLKPSQSWDDIRGRFEKELGLDLGWFFKQWVDRKGLPDLRVEQASVRRNGNRFEIALDLVQKGEVYTLDVPISISFIGGGGKSEVVKLETGNKKVTILVDEEPSAVTIDREYDVPRKLTEAETPPFLANVLSDEKPLLATAVTNTDIYAGAVAAWKPRGAEERQSDTIKDAEIKSASVIAFGTDNPLVARLYGKIDPQREALALVARKNPWNPGKVVLIVQARTAKDASGALSAVIQGGMCSSLSIDTKGRVSRKTLESEQGIVIELREEAVAIEVSARKTLSSVIEAVLGKKIVYVGEYHDRFAHHNVQLQIIRGLYQRDPKIAVGMEMFQRPFQKTLDEYIGGSIDEREFLKKAEYFKRWSYDYNLYKPILDFCRAEKIPIVALNLRRELTDKVSKTGLDSLTNDERKELPAEMDFSDTEYRDRLKQVFEQHEGQGDRSFDFFLQSQLLWDESMAWSIDEYLQKNPDQRMIVIAGLGHIAYGSGIPKRSFRRNGHAYATVLSDVAVERDIADYVVFPQSLDGVMSPKIMAVLKEDAGRVRIADLPGDSVSRKAGLRAGDTLVSVDGALIGIVDDLKIALFYKKRGETVRIRIVRRRFLLGDAEREFDVKLP